MFEGCFTALVTPMKSSFEIDFSGLKKLVQFQIEAGVKGIVVMGTTGESPTISWQDHKKVIERVHDELNDRAVTIAGTGSNSTEEAFEGTAFVHDLGIKAALLVDPYYNGPSSLEIRKEYIEPLSCRFPEIQFIPYIIPGRTGTQLLSQDLAVLHHDQGNVNAVKEATGDLANMVLTRKLCGNDFDILSGDDDKTREMMTSPHIRASGVISVISNFAPAAVQEMTQAFLSGNAERGFKIAQALEPLFKIVTVKSEEDTPYGARAVKARNPLPCKTLMNVLGLSSGPCRQPLGKMTETGLTMILEQAKQVYENNPWILEPVEAFFGVNLKDRLYYKQYWTNLYYV